MAKVEGKDSDTLRELANAGLASELDSRLRDLERNIAVAKEFIKLADESYSEVRREWSLLQQDIGNRAPQTEIARSSLASDSELGERGRSRRGRAARRKTDTGTNEAGGKEMQTLTKIDADLHRTKVEVPEEKEPDTTQESEGQTPRRHLKRLHSRAK